MRVANVTFVGKKSVIGIDQIILFALNQLFSEKKNNYFPIHWIMHITDICLFIMFVYIMFVYIMFVYILLRMQVLILKATR